MSDYHGRIMNIQHRRIAAPHNYVEGHRDARHAAAEIAAEADAELAAFKAERDRLREALERIVNEADHPLGCAIDGNEMGEIARAALAKPATPNAATAGGEDAP